MKGDDSCCQGGKNKDFKGSSCGCASEMETQSCGCTEEVETPKKVMKGKAKVMQVKEEHSGCCGSH